MKSLTIWLVGMLALILFGLTMMGVGAVTVFLLPDAHISDGNWFDLMALGMASTALVAIPSILAFIIGNIILDV